MGVTERWSLWKSVGEISTSGLLGYSTQHGRSRRLQYEVSTKIHDLCKRKHPDGSPSRSKSFLADRDSRISLAMYRQVTKMLEALGPLRPSKLIRMSPSYSNI